MRRSPRDVDALSRAALAVLSSQPGMTRTAVAATLGVEPDALALPIVHLLHAGVVERRGHKSKTRYRPTPSLSRREAPGFTSTRSPGGTTR